MTYPVISDYATSSTAASGTAHSLTLPTVSDGDLLVAIFGLDCGINPVGITGMTGWTQVFADTNTGFQPTTYCYYKLGAATDSGTNANFTSLASEQMVGVVLALRLCVPAVEWSITTYAPDPPYNAPTLTAGSTQEYLVLTGLTLNRSSPCDVIAVPGGYTDLFGTHFVADVAMSLQHRNVLGATISPTGNYGTSGTSDWSIVNLAGADPTAEVDRDYFSFTLAISPVVGSQDSRLMLLGAG